MDAWDKRFAERSALLSPLREAAVRIAGDDWPETPVLQRLLEQGNVRTAAGRPLQLVRAEPACGEAYEVRLYARGELEFRERGWHDLFNVLMWLQYPRAKAALNARHHAAFAGAPAAGRRGPVRDALTLFDEDGIIVLSADPRLLRMIRDFQWKRLFWEHRAEVTAGMRFLPFGHALCGKALAPYKGMTGRGLLLEVSGAFLELAPAEQAAQIDGRVAQWLADPEALRRTRDLAPVPVLGVPGWGAGNDRAGYYDDADCFRPGRGARLRPRQPVAAATAAGKR